ncbi:MAG: hypothetical protein V3R66_04520 [Rhodospirillales bacterium]
MFGPMNEVLNFPNPAPPGATINVQGNTQGYQAAREVKARAAVTQTNDSIKDLKAISRLNRFLDANEPLNDDVPRGFYINIQV